MPTTKAIKNQIHSSSLLGGAATTAVVRRDA
jgi:hypothetical protein